MVLGLGCWLMRGNEFYWVRPFGRWFLTMKWFDRTAHGFSPGLGGLGEVPCLTAVVCGAIGTKEEKWHPRFDVTCRINMATP